MRPSPFLLFVACTGTTATEEPPAPEPEPVHYGELADCGARPAEADMARLLRWPYLQNVTPDSAVVVWGTAPSDTGTHVVLDDGRNVTPQETLQVTALDEPLTLHFATVDGLTPGASHCYAIGDAAGTVAGKWRFTTAPASGDAPARFLVLGDFGNGSEAQLQLRETLREHTDGVHFWLTTGDNAYPDGTHQEFQDHVFDVYREFWTDVPVYPTPGNHDYKTDSAQPYLDNFVLPRVALTEIDQERYYAIDWGVVHWSGIDSQEAMYRTNTTPGDDQFDWLDDDLTKTDRAWKIAGWHYPPYSGQPGRAPDIFAWGRTRPAVEAKGVQLVLTGHNHMYERFANIHDDARTADGLGTTYIVTGGGGASTYEIGTHPLQTAVAKEHHFMVFEATSCTLHGKAIATDGALLDEFTLDRCEGATP
jgi:3',5'-cyclic AMP phosphodiesterase CpdA